MQYALAANPTMTIAVVDKIAKTTRSKPFTVVFSFNVSADVRVQRPQVIYGWQN